MANSVEQRPAKTTDNNANQTSHYVTLGVAIVLGLVGTFLRFVQDSFMMSTISNIILAVAWLIAFRIVFRIMK
jgi:hypothetical protein